MPGPVFEDHGRTEQQAAPAAATPDHDELALELPRWDLLPPAEFVRRAAAN
jgi:hypothetical protein